MSRSRSHEILLTRVFRTLGTLFLLSLALLVSGCGKVALFSELSELEANEMMAILLAQGVECDKAPGKDEAWVLSVPTDQFSRAVELLKAQGFPRDKFTKIGDVFQKTGLVSSPTEERIRYMYALSQELSETLTRIDGVLNARVHIVIPDNDPLAERVTPSSAAIFIRYRPGFDIESLTPQLKNLVTRSIEGLNYDNVSLVLIPAVTTPIPSSLTRSAEDRQKLLWLVAASVVAAAAATTAFILSKRKAPATETAPRTP